MSSQPDPPKPELPLAGRRILVTRAAQQAGKLSDGLKALGATPVEVPVLEIRPPDSYDPLDHALEALAAYNWLILTSTNTVQAVAARCALLKIEIPALRHLQVAAVGSATADAARQAGFHIAVIPDHYHSEGVVAALGPAISGKRVLLARAKVARDIIPEALTQAGARLTVVDAYQTVLPAGSAQLLSEALRTGLDAATFTSSSSVRNLAEVARAAGAPFPFPNVPAISIGPLTSTTLREQGWPPAAEAKVSTIPGLLQAIIQAFHP